MSTLRKVDLHAALRFVGDVADAGTDAGLFAAVGVEALPRLVACEITTLSVCDLASARRHVVGSPGSAYYRRIGIDHVVAVPIEVDARTLVSFVLNRSRRDFSDRECALLDLVGAHLARQYRRLRLRAVPVAAPRGPAASALARREREVVRWVAAGKTDRDIALVLGCSHRTVHKHLERSYAKLGVETRTAAVMRALGMAVR